MIDPFWRGGLWRHFDNRPTLLAHGIIWQKPRWHVAHSPIYQFASGRFARTDGRGLRGMLGQ